MSFPEKLKFLRESNNHTQQNLADLLGVRKSSISNYETGRSYPKRMVLLKLAKIYNIPPSSFLESEDVSKIASVNEFKIESAKKIFVYKNFAACFLEKNAPASYCISLPAGLIGNGEYKAFIAPSGSIIIVEPKKAPQSGDAVIAYTNNKVVFGKYCLNNGTPAIISKYIDFVEETSIFDIENDKISVLAVAVKTLDNSKV